MGSQGVPGQHLRDLADLLVRSRLAFKESEPGGSPLDGMDQIIDEKKLLGREVGSVGRENPGALECSVGVPAFA